MPEPTHSRQDWNQRYETGNTPWDTEIAAPGLIRLIDDYAISPCRAIELGCGTGTNALYLVQRSFDVLATDISELALEKARRRAAEAGVDLKLRQMDVLDLPADLGGPFDLVYDVGCYHAVRRVSAERFLTTLTTLSKPGGYYITLAGNANEENPEGMGPPRVSAGEMIAELSPGFELVQLTECRFTSVLHDSKNDRRFSPLAWSALWRRKGG